MSPPASAHTLRTDHSSHLQKSYLAKIAQAFVILENRTTFIVVPGLTGMENVIQLILEICTVCHSHRPSFPRLLSFDGTVFLSKAGFY